MFLSLLALLMSACSLSTREPVKFVIFPTHMSKVTSTHTRKIRAEKIPVLIRKESVGNLFYCCVSETRDYLGTNQRISSTNKGRIMPVATMMLGIVVQSFKKQIINPIIPKAHTATVPGPTPITRPL